MDGEALQSERLKARLGEMLLERELLEAKIALLEPPGPGARPSFSPLASPLAFFIGLGEAAAMSAAASPSSGKPHGTARVCRLFFILASWHASRATLYRHRPLRTPEPTRRRGPAGPMPDAELPDADPITAIRAVLADDSCSWAPLHDGDPYLGF